MGTERSDEGAGVRSEPPTERSDEGAGPIRITDRASDPHGRADDRGLGRVPAGGTGGGTLAGRRRSAFRSRLPALPIPVPADPAGDGSERRADQWHVTAHCTECRTDARTQDDSADVDGSMIQCHTDRFVERLYMLRDPVSCSETVYLASSRSSPTPPVRAVAVTGPASPFPSGDSGSVSCCAADVEPRTELRIWTPPHILTLLSDDH